MVHILNGGKKCAFHEVKNLEAKPSAESLPINLKLHRQKKKGIFLGKQEETKAALNQGCQIFLGTRQVQN
jgi:hypothetical protein